MKGLLVLLACGTGLVSCAELPADATSLGPVPLEQSERFRIASRSIGSYLIDVVLPEPARPQATSEKLPVAFVTDTSFMKTVVPSVANFGSGAGVLRRAMDFIPRPDQLLGRGRVVTAPRQAPRARVLTSQPAAAELSRWATMTAGRLALTGVQWPSVRLSSGGVAC